MQPREDRPIKVLMVEDSPTDTELAELAFEKARVNIDLCTVTDGVEAMAFLRNEAPHQDAFRPDLILLDLNLPRKDGRQVLEEIRADRRLTLIPVVILTTSSAKKDIERMYASRVSSYITKPVDFEQFTEAVRTLNLFWFSRATLPN